MIEIWEFSKEAANVYYTRSSSRARSIVRSLTKPQTRHLLVVIKLDYMDEIKAILGTINAIMQCLISGNNKH